MSEAIAHPHHTLPDGWLHRVAADARGGVFEDCGHWIAEEQPRRTLDELLRFFD